MMMFCCFRSLVVLLYYSFRSSGLLLPTRFFPKHAAALINYNLNLAKEHERLNDVKCL